MATGVDELMDMLFDMIDEAKNAPLSSGKCVIERDKALDIIEDVKAQFPVELVEARKILNARAEFVAAARREAEEIKKRAEQEASQMVSETEVVRQARQKASEILKQAEAQGWEVTYLAPGPDGAVSAADVAAALRPDTALVSLMLVNNLLLRTEEALADAHAEMRKVHSDFRSAMDSLTPPAHVQQQNQSGRKLYDAEADQ